MLNSVTSSAKGTLDYISPEGRTTMSNPDVRSRPFPSDIYSLGLTILHLAKFSLRPELSSSVGDALSAVLESEVGQLEYSMELKTLLLQMLAVNPASRLSLEAVQSSLSQSLTQSRKVVSGETLRDAALSEIAQYHYAAAAEIMNEAWMRLLEEGSKEAVEVGLELGELLCVNLTHLADAERVFERCLQLQLTFAPHSEQVIALRLWLVGVLFYSGKWEEVEAPCMLFLDPFDSENAELYWTAAFYLFLSYIYLSKTKRAVSSFERLMKRTFQNESPKSIIYRLFLQGRVNGAKGHNTDAERIYGEVATLCEAFPTSNLRHFNLVSWGLTLYSMQQYREAAEKYEEAHLLYSQHFPHAIETGDNLMNWGLALDSMQQYREAAEKYEEAHRLYSQHFSYAIDTGKNLMNWGLVCEAKGEKDAALSKYIAALDVFRIVKSPVHIKDASQRIAKLKK